ncbi:Hypothetical protein KVN_LOCUS160 [uncultured virus]|nr:Hypothetical protein KVN_LOCUS160 [uncultured virus]
MDDDEGWVTVKNKKISTFVKKKNTVLNQEPKKILLNNNFSEYLIKGNKTIRIDKEPKIKINKNPNKKKQQINAKKIEESAEEGDFHLNVISHELKTQIQQARLNKKLTQKDLAIKCNLPLNIIQSYEQGKGFPEPDHLVLLSKILDVKLSNKKKT